MIFSYDEEFMNIKIYDDIPDIREGKPKEIIEIPDIMDAWEFYKSVVRCKECKHNYNTAINHGKMQPRCDFTDWKLTENDYCSRGERKEGE